MLEDTSSHDVRFSVRGEPASAHRFLLAARSPYFARRFAGGWRGRGEVAINNPLVSFILEQHLFRSLIFFSQVDPDCFRLVLEWLYTGQAKVEVSSADDFGRLCRNCRLDRPERDLEDAVKRAKAFGD